MRLGIVKSAMRTRTEDLRIQAEKPLVPPAILHEEVPANDHALETVVRGRTDLVASLTGENRRLVCIVGPCSIHDPIAALDYAHQLKALADRFADSLVVVMRTYFEKPRTRIGWKGLINDPDMNGSCEVNKGLRIARRLLVAINEIGLPVGCEFLEATAPQHIADLVAWSAIGARTTESQIHRQLASGLSMPVGFKNTTDGSVKPAVDAIVAASQPHWFLSVTQQGLLATFHSTGNEHCHVILRGGVRTGPNYARQFISETAGLLRGAGLPARIMVDCSHGNSLKDHTRQALVAGDIAEQVRSGTGEIFGVMIESNLVAGRQDSAKVYGQSITDACIDLCETERVFDVLASAMS